MIINGFLRGRSALIFGALLLSTACGSSGEAQNPGDETTTTAPADIPAADDDGRAPDSSGMCAEGEPDCDDTIVTGDDGDLPDGGDEPDSSGMPVDGGLTIADALAGDSSEILAVRGYLLGTNNQLRLCEDLVGGGEGYKCGGASVILRNLDTNDVAGLVFQEGTTFAEDEIIVLGTIYEGVLEVNDLVQG